MPPTLAELVTVETLSRLAGPRSFGRGEEAARLGAVGALSVDGTSVRAGVQGTERYRVRIEASPEGLVGACSCPVGRDGGFCKHCVAVGLSWLSRAREEGGESFGPSRDDLEQRLISPSASSNTTGRSS